MLICSPAVSLDDVLKQSVGVDGGWNQLVSPAHNTLFTTSPDQASVTVTSGTGSKSQLLICKISQRENNECVWHWTRLVRDGPEARRRRESVFPVSKKPGEERAGRGDLCGT